MSGGVDSAVALLRALPNAVGVTLRLWLDPPGPTPSAPAARPSRVIAARETLPPARRPARHARPARGVPARGRRRRSSAATRAARRRTRASGATAASASPSCSPFARRAGARTARDRPLRANRRATGAGSCWRAAQTRARTSRTCSPGSTRPSSAGSGSRSATRTRRRRAPRPSAPASPSPAARESQEACFLAGDDYRAFLGRHGARGAARARSSTEDGRELGRHDGYWRFTPGQRKRDRRRQPERRSTCSATSPSANAVVVGPRAALARRRVAARGRLYADVERGSRRSSATARPARPPPVTADGGGFELDARRAGLRRRAAGRPPSSTTATPSSGAVLVSSAADH